MSNFCFVIYPSIAEIIAIKIRGNKEINGIIIDDVEIKLSLMADSVCIRHKFPRKGNWGI